mgnify:CR=1 FL=1
MFYGKSVIMYAVICIRPFEIFQKVSKKQLAKGGYHMMKKRLFLRWKNEDKNFCTVEYADVLKKKIEDVLADYSPSPELEELITNFTAIEGFYFDVDSIKKNSKADIIFEYWFDDANSGTFIIEATEDARNILDKALIKPYVLGRKKWCIPDTFNMRWKKDGKNYNKDMAREEFIERFQRYIIEDATNNGISKKLVVFAPLFNDCYISWDNDAEINSLYYKRYWEGNNTKGIPIPGIHRKIWGELRKICDITE